MTFEFVHSCNDTLLNQMAQLIGTARYFLICIGNLNYFYSADPGAVAIIKGLLMIDRIALHALTQTEMLDVLNTPGTKEFQVFHGNRELFEMFIAKSIA